MAEVEWFELMRKGKWANANVYRFCRGDNCLVRKGFCFRSFLVRWSLGSFLTWRETVALHRLSGIPGVPENIKRCSAFALRYRYMKGRTLGDVVNRKQHLQKSYFLEAEKLLAKIHERKMVHLDLRRGDNWIVQPDGNPGIIDFQSTVSVGLLPQKLQEKLYAIDYSGLYKLWKKTCEEELDPERQALLDRVNRGRRFWILKGYAFQKRRKKR